MSKTNMNPLTYSSAMALAQHCEDRAYRLEPCDRNLRLHAELMERAETLRKIARRIAAEKLRQCKNKY